jgi:lantibiotic modifying enzyme
MKELVNDLIDRSQCIDTEKGFLVASDKLPSKYHMERFPNGCVDCGMAHGVPGVLASLSLVQLFGKHVPRLNNTIQVLSKWILSQKLEAHAAPRWPMGVGPDSSSSNYATQLAWCYGTPGVSNALLLAGQATGDESLQQVALETFKSITAQSSELAHIEQSAVLCHGVAGLLQMTFRFLQVGFDAELQSLATRLSTKLIVQMEGYLGDMQSSPNLGSAYLALDLLDGAVGTALVLATGEARIEPAWDQMLLLQ